MKSSKGFGWGALAVGAFWMLGPVLAADRVVASEVKAGAEAPVVHVDAAKVAGDVDTKTDVKAKSDATSGAAATRSESTKPGKKHASRRKGMHTASAMTERKTEGSAKKSEGPSGAKAGLEVKGGVGTKEGASH